MRKLLALVLLPAGLSAAILPETIGSFHRTATSAAALSDRPLWDEYGLKESETAAYEDAAAKFTVTAWRLADSTSALAVFDWQRPPQATPSKAAALAAETPDSLTVAQGNYVLFFQRRKPTAEELTALIGDLRHVDPSPLPVLASYLPGHALVPDSERYILGPAGLERFDPGIPPSVAAFHLGAEAQLGVFRSPKGNLTLAIFNYPTPQIAMQQIDQFTKLPQTVAKRSGPLVAVIQNSPDADFAERLLSDIRYQAIVTRDEYVPTRRDNMGDLLVTICVLTGILLAFMVVSGLAFGGVRTLWRLWGKGTETEGTISLHLERR